jgi:EAL domain-containing protein (putative c-di-GMP-specific phosphodiesterase class I)
LLEHIPVDYLTVDASIVNQVREDKKAIERITSISTRARSLGKFSCAEYVEDAASVGLLYDAGIDFVQGFYIQPPSPALDFEFSMMVG